MKDHGLVPALAAVALLGAGAFARPSAALPDSSAREAVERLDAAMAPLRRGDYEARERRAVLDALVHLQTRIAAIQLSKIVDETVRQEKEFWAGREGLDAAQKLPAKTADALKRRTAEISSVFYGLFPGKAGAQDPAVGRPSLDDASGRLHSTAKENPGQFFDGAYAKGAPADGVSAVNGGPAENVRFAKKPAGLDASRLPFEPTYSLQVKPVPSPSRVRTEAACASALKDRPDMAGLCGSSPTAAPVLAGLLEALKEQFGTAQGLVMNAAFLLLGVVLSALSGIGLVAQVVVSLASAAMIMSALLPLLRQFGRAVSEWGNTNAGDVRHAKALMALGKAGGTALVLALMAALGVRLGQSAPAKGLVGSVASGMSSALKGLGIDMAALDAGVPASIKAFLGGAAKPAAESLQDPRLIRVTDAIGKHLFEDGVIKSRETGITQGHSRAKFLAALEQQGKILSETPVPGYEGVSLVKYQLYAESRGVRTTALKSKIHAKTIVDANVWTESKATALAKSIFGNERRIPESGAGTYRVFVTRGKVRFIGWVDRATGTMQSFGVDEIRP